MNEQIIKLNMKENSFTHKGFKINSIGLGTYRYGDNPKNREKEIKFIRNAILNYGINTIDTAEEYANGVSEEIIGEAIKGLDRSKLFIVSKVYPINVKNGKTLDSLRASLKRLGTSYVDLYLLHWRQGEKLVDFVNAMKIAKKEGLIKEWGVSNFGVGDMEELFSIAGGDECFANQCLYNVADRNIEAKLLPWLKEHGVLFMAFSPLCANFASRDRCINSPVLNKIATKHGVSVEAIMLAFLIRNKDLFAVVKTTSEDHLEADLKGAEVTLDDDDLMEIEKEFPSPIGNPNLFLY